MLYGRRLDQSLSHVDGSRYALVHAVAKRARQITLWLTADPAELRAESAPPPAPGELVTRDPVALAEAEILEGEVRVRWDPEGLGEDVEAEGVETDPLLIETLDDEGDSDGEGEEINPALAQVLGDSDEEEGSDEPEPASDDDESAETASVAEEADSMGVDGDELETVGLDDVEEEDEDLDEEEDEDL